MPPQEQRLRVAELTSSVGAGVLGVGLGILLGSALTDFAGPILVAGGFMHVWGMLDKHRIERFSGAVQPTWSLALYWLCWVALAVLAIVLVVRVMD